MFGLFKRTKIEGWETQLLRNVITKLPKEYFNLINQIDDGLLKGVLVGISDIPGYVAFTFHSSIFRKYDRDSQRDFKLTNIKIYDNRSSNWLLYEIYVSSGTISGYSLDGEKKCRVDVNKIDVSTFIKQYIESSDYNFVAGFLNEEEKKLLNPAEVYLISIDNKDYFHIKDLEDGIFFGIDEKKVVYKITHDPLEAVAIGIKISDVLKE
jgi:hypothetical protein